MKEFEFSDGSLEAQGLQVGDVVECTYSDAWHITVGKSYQIEKSPAGELCIINELGCARTYYPISTLLVKFKPVQVNTQQQQGHLHDILTACKEGDMLECVDSKVGDFAVGTNYYVRATFNGVKYIVDDDGTHRTTFTKALFIKLDVQSNCTQTKDEHAMNQNDSWGIGKSYDAPKKEWQPDVLDVDLSKKIWEW